MGAWVGMGDPLDAQVSLAPGLLLGGEKTSDSEYIWG